MQYIQVTYILAAIDSKPSAIFGCLKDSIKTTDQTKTSVLKLYIHKIIARFPQVPLSILWIYYNTSVICWIFSPKVGGVGTEAGAMGNGDGHH